MFTAYAQANCGIFQFGGCNNVIGLVKAGTDSFFAIIWVVVVIVLAYGGFLYITSVGDKPKAELAKATITNALIGLVVVLGISVLINITTSLISGGTFTTVPTIGTFNPNNPLK